MNNHLKEAKTYYNNGVLHQHYFLNKKCKRVGEYKSWCSNGQLLANFYYNKGKVFGISIKYI